MDRAERIELLARIARGEEQEEKVGKEGPFTVSASLRDRLAALRMLAELDGDLERAKRIAKEPDEDDSSNQSTAALERQLRIQWGLEPEESK